MPVSCEPQDLITAAGCLNTLPPGMLSPVQTYLLAVMAGTSTDPAVLLPLASCFTCLNPNQLAAINTYLLCQIANGGGGGGASGITCSPSSDPSGAPAGGCGIWVRLDLGQMWVYNSGTANWDAYIA